MKKKTKMKVPNAETRKVIKQGRKGKNLRSFRTVKSLMKDLMSELKKAEISLAEFNEFEKKTKPVATNTKTLFAELKKRQKNRNPLK